MVRNTTGGTKTKGLARKHQNSGGSSGHIRVPECKEEQFAYVAKMLGNGMCEVYIGEKNTRLIGHIRSKFRGRQKRNNQIVANSIVLVGIRTWESTPKNCDILCVYDDNEIKQLKNRPGIGIENVAKIQSINTIGSNQHEEGYTDVVFTTNIEEEDNNMNKIKNTITFKIDNEEIDLDDI
jgi:initiation factor 1A